MRSLILILAVLSAGPSWAAGAVVKDGGTLQVAGVTYRLDGIDAPELDQMCIDEHADAWACGVEARDQLTKLIGGRAVRCEDLGLAPYKSRHIGVCTVEGETATLNQLIVRQGFALNFEPYARGRFRDDEAGAKDKRLGLWKGCFAAPYEFRRGRKDGTLLGDSCRTDKDQRDTRGAVPRTSRDAAGLQHQGQTCGARPRHRQCRRLSPAGMSQLPRHDGAGSLVLHRGRRPGRGISQGV